MNKDGLVKGMAGRVEGATQKEAKKYLDAFAETVVEGLEEDGRVQLSGLFTMEVKDTPERQGFNPQTQEPMTIPAGKRVAVRVSNNVKELF